MNLPPDFIKTIQSTFKEEGRAWLIRLPELIARASRQWGLSDVQPVSNLSYNFVAFAKREPSPFGRGQGEGDTVLKIGVPRDELTSEMAALKLFDGDGACQLLECDEERGLLLLERLKPGKMLAELEDDDERTSIAADVMKKIWRDVPERRNFILLSNWFDGLKEIRPHFNGGMGVFPKKLLEQVESILPELFADENIKLMHGDFHHYNVLFSERGWLVIDPKGVIGPVGYETAPLMMNPWGELSSSTEFKARADRRAGILSERLGIPRGRIIQWATAHAILSTWWGIEDGTGWEYSLWCAENFSNLT
jgi:streptomycin 6-kinase